MSKMSKGLWVGFYTASLTIFVMFFTVFLTGRLMLGNNFAGPGAVLLLLMAVFGIVSICHCTIHLYAFDSFQNVGRDSGRAYGNYGRKGHRLFIYSGFWRLLDFPRVGKLPDRIQ